MGLKERGNSEWGAGQWASFFYTGVALNAA
jgi:hypothetical protein